ncbi:MAG TPA: P-II family nitrogen regulator [Proteobacteria bacterium]|nr:P-II family nitrogen regulator [Deltaproteobacteria bacterium]HDS16084.1 P-II family nitrogen regulator [Pseudomonadota bacterium]
MKIVTAIIQPDKLDEVREELVSAGISRITTSRVTGHGQHQKQLDSERLYRGQKVIPNLLPKVRLDIACNDEYVEIAIEAILRSAKHGEGRIGDGKIFVTELQRCIRIRTEEQGPEAI